MDYDKLIEASIQIIIATGIQENLHVLLWGNMDKPNKKFSITNTIDSEGFLDFSKEIEIVIQSGSLG